MIESIVIVFLFICLYNYTKFLIFSKMVGKKITINVYNIILFIIFSVGFTINSYFVLPGLRFILTFVLCFVFYKVLLSISFKSSLFYNIVYSLFLELSVIPSEYIFSYLFGLNTGIFAIKLLPVSLSIGAYSVLIILLFDHEGFYQMISKFKLFLYNRFSFYITGLILINSTNILFHALKSLPDSVYIMWVVLIFAMQLMFVFCILLAIYICQKYSVVRDTEYNLLKNNYNKVNLEYRNMRHNLMNDLLALKTTDKEYANNLIDTMIFTYKKDYDQFGLVTTDKTGIEGVIDIKLKEAHKMGLNVTIESNKSLDNLDYLNDKYLKVCETIGIVLDNAIESSKETKDKIIYVDIIFDNNLTIKVVNSFNNKIDVDDLYKLDYSTKNRNSGLGLSYIESLKPYGIKTEVKIVNSLFIMKIIV